MTQCPTVSLSSQDNRPPNNSMQPSHTPYTEEALAHLDRKCLVVLSETSSLQLYTYFTNEVKGYIQAWFHRTLLVPKLNIGAARKWPQCFLCRKSFLFSLNCSRNLIVSLCQLTALMFVCIQNESPNSLFRERLWWEKKRGSHAMRYSRMQFPNLIKWPQLAFALRHRQSRLHAHTDWNTTEKLCFPVQAVNLSGLLYSNKTNYATAINKT